MALLLASIASLGYYDYRAFGGTVLIPPLFMLPWVLRERRIRFPVVCLVSPAAGMTIEIYLFPHYLAPFTSAFCAVELQSMRHLYQNRVASPWE